MDILRREIAPLSGEVLKQIDEAVAGMARRTMAARTVATFEGPRGWNQVAVALGTVTPHKTREGQAVVSLPDVVLLAEIRAAFTVTWGTIEAVERGAPALDATGAEIAAREVALAEDRLAFYGEPGGKGFLTHGDSPRQPCGDWSVPSQVVTDLLKAVERLDTSGIPGPYEAILAPARYYAYLRAADDGYPASRHLRDVLVGVHRSAVVKDAGALFSTRGGDFVLTVGGDLSVGYRAHDQGGVHLFCVETVAAQVVGPDAVCVLTSGKETGRTR
jgi:uncharacterized linocin/CFP29 family protein